MTERNQHREKKLSLKTKGMWLKEAQREFNKWIRWRDRDLPCICCGRQANKWDAGHCQSVGAPPERRVEPDKCHKQRARPCNSDKSGNANQYRKRLVKKIGVERVEFFEGPHEPLRLTIEDIKEIKAKYQKLNRESVAR